MTDAQLTQAGNSPTVPLTPQGWQTDPRDPTLISYWDGTQYTAHMRWDGTQWVHHVPGGCHATCAPSNPAELRSDAENCATATRPVFAAATSEPLGQPSVASLEVLTTFSPVHASKGRRSRSVVRSHLLIIVVLILLAGGGALGYSFVHGSGNGVTGDSPSQIVALSTSAVEKAGSVHVVTSIQIQGNVATYVNNTGSGTGSQVISAGNAEVTAIVVGATVYVNANQLAMSQMFQGSVASSQQFAGKWLSFPSSSKAYQLLAQTLTIGSLLQQVTPTGRLTKLGPSVIRGQSVIGVRGELPGDGTGTLYISATGLTCPRLRVHPL